MTFEIATALLLCAVLAMATWSIAETTWPGVWQRAVRSLRLGGGRHRMSFRQAMAALVRPVGGPSAPQEPSGAAEGLAEPPTVVDPSTVLLAPIEMTETDAGAENWGDLLTAMNTEERVIIHQETWTLRQQMLAWERPALAAFNDALDRAMAGWCECPEHLHLKAAHAEDIDTAAWPLVYAAPLREDERELAVSTT